MKTDQDFTSEYRLTSDPDFLLDYFNVPSFVRDQLTELHQRAEKGDDKSIQKLLKLIVRFPGVPQLKNLLTVAYRNGGKDKKAYEANRWLVKEHPEYIFGRINLANESVNLGDPDKVPEILGEILDLQKLFPDRKIFHIQEYTGFEITVINYLCELGEIEAARSRYKVMDELAPDLPDTRQALLIIEDAEEFLEWEPGILDENGLPFIPEFTHKEIEWLYNMDLTIPEDMVKVILDLPQESLIRDLEVVLQDARERYHYYAELFYDNDLGPNQIMFAMHAIFLLGELKSHDSLPKVLELLEEETECLDLWFGDIVTEGLWEPLYYMGESDLGSLTDFIKNSSADIFARVIPSTVVSKITIYHPDRRKEVLKWYEEVLSHFITERSKGVEFDPVFITMIAIDVIICRLHELLPVLNELLRLDMVEVNELGSPEEIESEIRSPINSLFTGPAMNIFGRYQHLIELFGSSLDPEQDEDEFDNEEEEEYDYPDLSPSLKQKTSTKVGRNDPCPCGSGKKYKHCCLKFSEPN